MPQSTLETALKSRKYKVVAFTHVDTSTGLLSFFPPGFKDYTINQANRRPVGRKIYSTDSEETVTGVLGECAMPSRLSVIECRQVVLDGVCSVASEEIRMDDWAIDIVMTASQKGLGAPPGLSILVASSYALKVYETRSAPIASYYASWKK